MQSGIGVATMKIRKYETWQIRKRAKEIEHVLTAYQNCLLAFDIVLEMTDGNNSLEGVLTYEAAVYSIRDPEGINPQLELEVFDLVPVSNACKTYFDIMTVKDIRPLQSFEGGNP